MYHKFMANVGKHSSPMDPMGYYDFFCQISTNKHHEAKNSIVHSIFLGGGEEALFLDRFSIEKTVILHSRFNTIGFKIRAAESRHVTNLSEKMLFKEWVLNLGEFSSSTPI